MTPTTDPLTTGVVGEISAACAYTIAEFSRRTGLGRWAIRSLRRDGLVVHRAAGRNFILGQDWITYLEGNPSGTSGPEGRVP